jgi:hypothetical protein
VVRGGSGIVALAFHQDPPTLGRVDQALATIGRGMVARAA